MPGKNATIDGDAKVTYGSDEMPWNRGGDKQLLVARDRDAGRRLDHFLAGQCDGVSRSRFKKMILDGLVTVNGRRVKPRRLLATGDRVEISVVEAGGEEQRLAPCPMPVEILYEDDAILVVNKAAGIVVHPGAGHRDHTLIQGILAHCPRLANQGAPLRPGIVHRLDQDTSGALVVAKSDRAYLRLVDQFKEHRVRKLYLALVHGEPRDCGVVRTHLQRHPKNRKKMAVAETGREAISRWRVKERFGQVSLLEVTIETGRTHQIRVHMNHLRHPVVGDKTYGSGGKRLRSLGDQFLRDLLSSVRRQMLHAFQLEFYHPHTGEWMSFRAPLPDDFAILLDRLRKLGKGYRS